MSPIRSKRRTLVAILGVLGVVVATPRPASAANPTMSECFSANDSAIKLRGDHKLRQARDQALVCAASSCPGEVRDACQKRVTELNTAIPSIVFEVKDASGNDVSAVVVTMDGQPFVERLDGTALPLDPGDHTFSFAAVGHPKVEKSVVIYEGDKSRRERIQIGGPLENPSPVLTLPAQVPLATTPSPETPPAQGGTGSPSTGLGTRRIVGLTLGGAGVVGVGVGAVLGALTLSAWSSAKNACGSGGTSRCATSSPSTVMSDHNTAETDGTVSTVAFIAGGALVATGLVVFLTGGHHGHEESPVVAVVPSLAPGQAGVALSGAF